MKKITLFALGAMLISANVSAETHAGKEYVDLGLSVMWATCNVGAENPEEYGDYFAWGETEVKTSGFAWTGYSLCDGNNSSINKYNSSDNLTQLLSEDDAATVNWGNGWRMPTKAEFDEIFDKDNCSWDWQTNYNNSGHSGYLITSKKDGYTANSIFLPTAGHIDGSTHYNIGNYTSYWSSSLCENNYPRNAYYLGLGEVTYGSRCYGRSVRPVVEKSKITTEIEKVELQAESQVRKIVENGVVYILRDGVKYTLTGQRAE